MVFDLFRFRLQSMVRVSRFSVCCLLMMGVVLPLTGCSKASHGDRIPLVGRVTKAGQPLDVKATIYFVPEDNVEGVGSSGQVDDSKFSIPVESGPTPGKKYKVRVMTAPGIPPDNTPRDQIRVAETMETTVEIPERGDDSEEFVIDFQ